MRSASHNAAGESGGHGGGGGGGCWGLSRRAADARPGEGGRASPAPRVEPAPWRGTTPPGERPTGEGSGGPAARLHLPAPATRTGPAAPRPAAPPCPRHMVPRHRGRRQRGRLQRPPAAALARGVLPGVPSVTLTLGAPHLHTGLGCPTYSDGDDGTREQVNGAAVVAMTQGAGGWSGHGARCHGRGAVRVVGSPVVAVQPLWLEGVGVLAPRCLFPHEGLGDVPMAQVSGSSAGLVALGLIPARWGWKTSSRAWGVQENNYCDVFWRV